MSLLLHNILFGIVAALYNRQFEFESLKYILPTATYNLKFNLSFLCLSCITRFILSALINHLEQTLLRKFPFIFKPAQAMHQDTLM